MDNWIYDAKKLVIRSWEMLSQMTEFVLDLRKFLQQYKTIDKL